MRRVKPVISMAVVLSLALTLLLAPATAGAGRPTFFFVPLSGSEEVPPRVTPASGLALIWLSADEESLRFILLTFKIENVVGAHIHGPIGPAGVNQPVVAPLMEEEPCGGGRSDGLLSKGTITEADLVGPLLGQPMADLVSALQAGNTYVNVHTNDCVAPTNTGPGDFPGGEVRGQID